MTARGIAVMALVVLSLAVPAGAQAPPPGWLQEAPASLARVETRHLVAEAEAVDLSRAARGRVTLRLRITPRPGMRIYAHDVVGYTPFSLRLDPVTGLTVQRLGYPVPTSYLFPPTGETSSVYSEMVTVEHTVVLTESLSRRLSSEDSATLPAALRYQACDDRLCYRPETVRLAWPVAR